MLPLAVLLDCNFGADARVFPFRDCQSVERSEGAPPFRIHSGWLHWTSRAAFCESLTLWRRQLAQHPSPSGPLRSAFPRPTLLQSPLQESHANLMQRKKLLHAPGFGGARACSNRRRAGFGALRRLANQAVPDYSSQSNSQNAQILLRCSLCTGKLRLLSIHHASTFPPSVNPAPLPSSVQPLDLACVSAMLNPKPRICLRDVREQVSLRTLYDEEKERLTSIIPNMPTVNDLRREHLCLAI